MSIRHAIHLPGGRLEMSQRADRRVVCHPPPRPHFKRVI